MLPLQWVRLENGGFCPFQTVNLTNVAANGIYIIWHGGQPARVVRVGQGDIADRLNAHRRDPQILAYRAYGLWVTWAAVSAAQRDGVERYLADQYPPLVGDAFPAVSPIAVNAPW
jgi:hypothetical protein